MERVLPTIGSLAEKSCFSELAKSLEGTVNFSLNICTIGLRLPNYLNNGIIKLLFLSQKKWVVQIFQSNYISSIEETISVSAN